MSWTKTKQFCKLAFKEGSISIVAYGITAYLILTQFADNPLVYDLFLYSYYVGLMITFFLIIFRIGLSQWVIARLRLRKLRLDLTNNNFSDLKDDKLNELIKPIMNNLVKDATALIQQGIKKEEKKEVIKEEVIENAPTESVYR